MEKEQKCNLSDTELCNEILEQVQKLALTGGKSWTLRVPVNFNRDPDMLICELVRRFKQKSSTENERNVAGDSITPPKQISLQEIEKEANEYAFNETQGVDYEKALSIKGNFIAGAKWMAQQQQGGWMIEENELQYNALTDQVNKLTLENKRLNTILEKAKQSALTIQTNLKVINKALNT